MVFGAIDSYNKFNELSQGTQKKQNSSLIQVNNAVQQGKKIDPDSLANAVDKQLKSSFIPFDSVQRKNILDQVKEQAKDSTIRNRRSGPVAFGGNTRFDKFVDFAYKNPDANVDEALDSLGYKKNFRNRFLYDRAKMSSTFFEDDENQKKFVNQMLSYGSVSLFILLPIFTLFLRFFYIRRKFTYVEHLIFVFHTQTVFFLLLIVFVLLNFFTQNAPIWLFTVLFLIYLYLAMKKFYSQGYIKTFIKYILVNGVYLLLATIGITFVALVSFALY